MIAVIEYGAGNIRSVLSALSRLGYEGALTSDPEVIKNADKVLFPGVGEASSAMAMLEKRGLVDVIRNLRQPFLGICLGLQLMCAHSEENDTDCLGIFPEPVLRFPSGRGEKIPHMGWNTIHDLKGPLFAHTAEDSWCYFVHSYYVPASPSSTSLTDYDGVTFSSSVRKDNFYGTQFHPEKSGAIGERILRTFLEEA